ncbi:MAG: hypothetical protein WDO73_04015 [Ignavibacteriota bacterium]
MAKSRPSKWQLWNATAIQDALPDLVDPAKNLVNRLGILGIDVDEKVSGLLPDLRKHYGVVVAGTRRRRHLHG